MRLILIIHLLCQSCVIVQKFIHTESRLKSNFSFCSFSPLHLEICSPVHCLACAWVCMCLPVYSNPIHRETVQNILCFYYICQEEEKCGDSPAMQSIQSLYVQKKMCLYRGRLKNSRTHRYTEATKIVNRCDVVFKVED